MCPIHSPPKHHSKLYYPLTIIYLSIHQPHEGMKTAITLLNVHAISDLK